MARRRGNVQVGVDLLTKNASRKASDLFRGIEGFARASQSVTSGQAFGGRLAPGLAGSVASLTGLLQFTSPLVNAAQQGVFGAMGQAGSFFFRNQISQFSGLTASTNLADKLTPIATAMALGKGDDLDNNDIISLRNVAGPLFQLAEAEERGRKGASAAAGTFSIEELSKIMAKVISNLKDFGTAVESINSIIHPGFRSGKSADSAGGLDGR